MKKILFFINDLGEGGAEKALISLVRNLDFTRYQIDIFLIYKQGVYLKDVPSEVKVYSLFSSRIFISLSSRLLGMIIKRNSSSILSWYINKKIKRKYDVIISFLEGLTTRCVSLINTQAIKIAWIHCDLIDYHWTQDAYQDINQEKEIYMRMNKLVFVSANAQNQFNQLFSGMNSHLQQVIYNVIDKNDILKKACETSPIRRKITLTLVGRMIPVKGLERFINVVQKLKEEGFDFEVWMLGNGILMAPIKELITSKDLQNTIILKGFKKNSYPYVKASDLFLNVSFSEGWSLTIAEALTLSTPVMATQTAGSAELLDNGEFGMLVENSEIGIYQGLKELLQNEILREEYCKKSKLGASQFEIEKTMNQINLLFEN